MKNILKLSISGVCLALCMFLPFITGQIPQIGAMLSPMHIPVLLCGFLCGWPYGLVVGIIAPLLRFVLFGFPVLYPMGISMVFELAVYGVVCGLLYQKLPKKIPYIYVTLVTAMILGRIVWGIARFTISTIGQTQFTFQMFLTAAFVTGIPGIILHILIVPLIVIALRKAKLNVNG